MAPSWLTPNRGAAPETPAAPAPTAREIQEMKDLPGVIQFMRLLNLGAAGGLIAAAVSLTYFLSPHHSHHILYYSCI